MNILVLGSGGREHSLVWAIAQNPKCDKIYAAPGNAGMEASATLIPELDPENGDALVTFCAEKGIDFVVIGPEAPLAAGVADDLRGAGVLTFGPSKDAAALEASKAFTKAICDASGAPTAAYGHFTDPHKAKAYIRESGAPIVVKADGLAAGKGVIIAMSEQEALEAIDDMFGGKFADAGAEVVIEEFMDGEEASFFVITDGEIIVPVGTAQDHKRAHDGDEGPNTGGMGAYSPAPVLSDAIAQKALEAIIAPTLAEMKRRGTPYQGVLYAGLMIKDGVPRLVEYNVRFGDPECQVLMMRLGGQILDLLLAAAKGELARIRAQWADDHAMTVVIAAKGYPGAYAKGSPIKGIDAANAADDTVVFHAGTARNGDAIVSNGGRVLNVTARGATLKEAQKKCYAAIENIDWDDAEYRRDIGWRAL
jgi:phosphoribosylamine--glycine ligase